MTSDLARSAVVDATASVVARADTPRALPPVVDSLFSLIGNTPCIPDPERGGLYLKLEGFNPTGTIADRLLLDATVRGAHVSLVGSAAECASAAMLAVALRLPATVSCRSEPNELVWLARAFGARVSDACASTIEFDRQAALRALARELAEEIPDVQEIVLPASSPLHCAVTDGDGIGIRWVAPIGDRRSAQLKLARIGILVDADTAACREMLPACPERVTVLVAQADGALEAGATTHEGQRC